MITLFEALNVCDIVELLKEVDKSYKSENKKTLQIRGEKLELSCSTLATFLYVQKIKKYKPNKSDDKKRFLFNYFFKTLDEEGRALDDFGSSMIREEDFGTELLPLHPYSKEDILKKSTEDLKEIYEGMLNNPDDSPTFYSYELCDVKDVLNYYIPQSMIDKYGMEKNLAAILFELTFLGFDEDEINSKIKEIKDNIDDAIELIENKNINEITYMKTCDSEETDLIPDEKRRQIWDRQHYISTITYLLEKEENYNALLKETKSSKTHRDYSV